MLDCHVSQFYEWLAFNRGDLDKVPADRAARRKWMCEQRLPDFARVADARPRPTRRAPRGKGG